MHLLQLKRLVLLVISLLLAGCVPAVIEVAEVEDNNSATVTKHLDEGEKEIKAEVSSDPSSLSAEVLYELLRGAIANQRQQPEVALDAFSRAAYLTRDKRINSNAIQLALHTKDYQKAIDLSRLLLITEPDNFRVQLALARAQIGNEKTSEASETLFHLAKSQSIGQEAVLQEIATLIARQPPAISAELQLQFEKLTTEKADIGLGQTTLTAALIASRREQREKFRTLLNQSLLVHPGWEVAAILKLTDLFETDSEAAKNWVEQFLMDHPSAESVRIQYARLLIDLNNLEQSLAQLEIVLEQNPQSGDALYIAAVINMDLEKPAIAEALFKRFIEKNKNGDQARLYLADILLSQQRYDEAGHLLRQVQSQRHYVDAQIQLGKIVAERFNIDDAMRYMENIDVYSQQDAIKVILEQNIMLQDANMVERSLSILTEALGRWPDQPDLLYNRGLLAAQNNYLEIVEHDMRRLIELEPDHAHAYNTLGYTLADQTDRYDEALALVSKANEFLPDDAFILDSMGWVYYRLGNLQLALEFLERALSVRQDAEIAAHLGEVLWVLGEQQKAEDIWRKGMEWAPENETLQKTMGKFLKPSKEQHAQQTSAVSSPLFPGALRNALFS